MIPNSQDERTKDLNKTSSVWVYECEWVDNCLPRLFV